MNQSPTLRDMLRRDFGVDLPISGGGGRRQEPIVISTATLQEAVDVQMQVHRCIGKGRQIAWRLEDTTLSDPASKLVRAGLETVTFLEDQVRTNGEGLYFVFDALPVGASATVLPAPTGFTDPGCGLRLPYQLAWLHLDAVTDNEPEAPGLGRTVAYGALGLKGTVYIYDLRRPLHTDDVEDERVVAQFRQAVGDALKVYADAKVTRHGVIRDAAGRSRSLMAVFDLSGEEMSIVLMTVRNGCFVKGRITFGTTERQFGDMAQDCVAAFMDAVRPAVGVAS